MKRSQFYCISAHSILACFIKYPDILTLHGENITQIYKPVVFLDQILSKIIKSKQWNMYRSHTLFQQLWAFAHFALLFLYWFFANLGLTTLPAGEKYISKDLNWLAFNDFLSTFTLCTLIIEISHSAWLTLVWMKHLVNQRNDFQNGSTLERKLKAPLLNPFNSTHFQFFIPAGVILRHTVRQPVTKIIYINSMTLINRIVSNTKPII